MTDLRPSLRWKTRASFAISLLLTLGIQTVAGQGRGKKAALPQPAPVVTRDPDFARLVKEWTTRPEFLSPLVDHLPIVAGIPSPKQILGYHIGAPKQLTYHAEIVQFYRTLASKSPRVKVIEVGRTDENRECVVVFVGSEETIKGLDQYRFYLAQLADPRAISDAQAREIVTKAKPIYHLMGGLHSGETGPPEMLMELAYRIAVDDTPAIRQIRDNVIVSITPVAEPDGRDRYVDWYYRHLIDIDDDHQRMPGPPYWGKYVFHDNNRDINYSQVTMRTLLDWYLQWHPPIMHELHESVPFLYTFSGQAPQNPTLDPILYGELPWFSNFEMAQMTKYGMPGVWTHAFVDMWSPGYLGFMASNHNGMLRMYETFGNGGATTMKRRVDAGEGPPGRGSQTTREWYRPLPPYKEVEWSMRNNTNYMQTGVLTALELASSFPKVILDNFYRKSLNSIESGKKDPPHGFVIPAGQPDMTRVELVVDILRTQGIEVGRATAEVNLKEGTFPEGSFIIKRDQPYGRLAKILLERQVLSDQNLRTYDDTGWTMGLMCHTEVKEIADKSILDLPTEPVHELKIRGEMRAGEERGLFAVLNHGSSRIVTLRYRLKDCKMMFTRKATKSGETDVPAGSLLYLSGRGEESSLARLRKEVEDLGLTALEMSRESSPVPSGEADIPRLALYSTWGNTQEVGWVRHALDKFEVQYELIFKERVRKGDLRSSYDVIVIPNQGRTGKGLVHDIEPRSKPIPYTKTEKFRNLGMYGEADDITGGMGLEGALEFQKFVQEGGVLITLGGASYFPAEFGVTRSIDASRPSGQFYAPGPIVEAEIVKGEHPIFFGYRSKSVPVRYANGPLLQVPERDRARQILMRFPGGDDKVLSGLMRGASEIRNRPAIVEVPVGKGRVILFATNPCYRWQNHGEFNMLFNAILFYSDPTTRPSLSR